MAQPQPTITTTYAGEFAGEYISAALLSGNTLANGLITVKPNVKYKSVLKTFSTGHIKYRRRKLRLCRYSRYFTRRENSRAK